MAEEAEIEEGVRGLELIEDEADEREEAGRGEHGAGQRGQAGEAVHQGDKTEAQVERALEVEALAAGVGPLALEPEDGQDERQGGDGDGRPEDAPPAPGVDEEPAQDRPKGEAGVDGSRVQPKGVAALAGRIDRGQDGDTRAEDHGPADALDGARQDEDEAGRSERAENGPGEVDADAEGEDTFAADEVGQAAEGDEEHGRGQRVGGQDPAEGDGAQTELLADERHGDVCARGQEGGQERGDHGDGEGRPAERPIGDGSRGWRRHFAPYYSRRGQTLNLKIKSLTPS